MPLILFLLTFILGAFLMWSALYLLFKISFLLSYLLVWTPDERRRYCPHGLLHALFCE